MIDCSFLNYSSLVTLLAIVYALFDVNYVVRFIFIIAWGKLFTKKKNVEEMTEIYGICTTHDLGIVLDHMNNARYIRELDFARFHFYDRTNLYQEITKNKGQMLQTACSIRYRKTISLLNTYKITTKIVYWDEKSIYMEQQFITLHDGFIRAVVLSKGVIGLNVPEIMAKLTGKQISYKPTPPEDVVDWISSIEKSSARLRKAD